MEKILLARARSGNNLLAVGNERDMTARFKQRITIFSGEVSSLIDGGIFLQDDLAPVLYIDLQRITLTDTQCASDLLRNNDPAKIVDPPYDSRRLHRASPLFHKFGQP